MGRIDYENEFSDAQSLIGTDETLTSTNVIDLNEYPQFIGGEDLHLAVTIGTALVGGTSVQVVVKTDAGAAMSSAVNIHTAPAVLTAAGTAGATLARVNLSNLAGVEQFIELDYVIVGAMSAGTVNAALEITPEIGAVTLA